MAGDEVADDVRVEPARDQRRGAGDDTVEDDGDALLGATEDQPYECGVLEAADRCEGTHGVVGGRAVERDRFGDDLRLVGEHRVVTARSTAGDLLGERSVKTLMRAAAGVVFARPTSPVARQR